MQATSAVIVSVLASAAVAVGVNLGMRPADASAPQSSGASLEAAMEPLRTELKELRQRLDTSAPRPAVAAAASDASASRSAAAISDEQVAAAVEAYLQRRGEGAGGAGKEGNATGGFDMEKDFAQLIGNGYWDNSEAWKRAFASGKMDDIVKRFEALAAAAPNDTKAQMDLAAAYLAYVQMDNTKWQMSMKADAVFDKVLAIDDKHWEARFTKAMSYTFWPDFLGKKKEAIDHFEVLIAQQETMPVQADQAQTYLFLGNLLEARDPAKAREVWQRGAQRHPDSTELSKRLSAGR